MKDPQASPWKLPWDLILIFFFLSSGFLTIGYFYNKIQLSYIQKEKQDELVAIANLKVNQIVSWRQERMADAKVISEDQFLSLRVKEWFQGSTPPIVKQDIVSRLEALKSSYYQRVVLLDLQGAVRLSVPGQSQKISHYIYALAKTAIQTRQVVFSDLYLSESSKLIRLSLLAPLLVMQNGDKIPIGVVVLQIDPHEFLYPLIQSWPTPNRTAENELLRREGDRVVFLNELRHQKNTALKLSFPLSEPKVAATAVRKGGGIIEGLDYRGIPIVGAVVNVPGSPWLLTAKVDLSEITAPLRERFIMLIFSVIGLLAIAGTSVTLVLIKQKRAEDEICAYQDRLRSLTVELSLVEARERHRLATELHENIGQILAFATIKMGYLLKNVPSAEMIPDLTDVRNNIKHAIRYTRSLTQQLSPLILYQLGFEEAIEWLAKQCMANSGLQVIIEKKQMPTFLREEVRILLFLALRELLNNVTRHAQVHQAKIIIDKEGNNYFFQVQDDGIGFDIAKAGSAGFGLFSIRERLTNIGWRLEIISNPGHGTTASLIVPCPKGQEG